MRRSILFVEDDALFGETIEEFLRDCGYDVEWVRSYEGAMQASFAKRFDILLLDIKLPDGDGVEMLEAFRKASDETPAIFLTSKKEDLKRSFRHGADDFLAKPVDLEELQLRIEALMRRYGRSGHFRIGDAVCDLEGMTIEREGVRYELHPKEARLLELLWQYRGDVVPKVKIYEALWEEEEASEGALRVYINRLKKILGKESIHNIRGVGYKLAVA